MRTNALVVNTEKIICVVFCDNVVESINWTASCEWY